MSPLDERIRQKGYVDASAPRAVVRSHPGAEPSDPPASAQAVEIDFGEEERETAKDLRRLKPWHKKAWDWIIFGHKMWVAYAAISGATIAAHAYIHGIVTGIEVKAVVKAALDEAIEEKRVSKADETSRITNLESQMSDMPAWRGRQTETVGRHEERLNGVEKLAEKTEHKVDSYLIRSTPTLR